MAGLLPSTPDTSAAEESSPRVIGLDDDEASDLLSALSSETARRVLAALHEEPTNAAELAERVDTSLQNVQYHLRKLDDAGLVSFSPEEGIVSARREPPGAWRDEAARVRLSTVARLVVTVGGVGVAFAAGVAVPDPAPFRSAWLVWSVTAIATLAACVYLSSSSLRSAR